MTQDKGYIHNKILAIIITLIVTVIMALVIYFSKSMGNLAYVLVGISFVGAILGTLIFSSSKFKFKGYSGRQLGSIIVIISILVFIPAMASFGNLVITVANGNNTEGIAQDKRDILFNLDKEKFTTNLELYHFSRNGLDIDKFSQVKKGNIDFYYDNNNSLNSIDNIEDIITNEGYVFNKFYGIDNVDNIKIAVADRLILDRTIGSYFSYNDITMVASSNEVDNLTKSYEEKGFILETTFQEAILHEYNHQLLRKAADERKLKYTDIPIWFIEGTAMYNYNIVMNKEIKPIDTKRVNIKNSKGFKGSNGAKYYNESMIFIKYLFDNHGDTVITDILDEASSGIEFYEAIKRATGQSFKEINSNIK